MACVEIGKMRFSICLARILIRSLSDLKLETVSVEFSVHCTVIVSHIQTNPFAIFRAYNPSFGFKPPPSKLYYTQIKADTAQTQCTLYIYSHVHALMLIFLF